MLLCEGNGFCGMRRKGVLELIPYLPVSIKNDKKLRHQSEAKTVCIRSCLPPFSPPRKRGFRNGVPDPPDPLYNKNTFIIKLWMGEKGLGGGCQKIMLSTVLPRLIHRILWYEKKYLLDIGVDLVYYQD